LLYLKILKIKENKAMRIINALKNSFKKEWLFTVEEQSTIDDTVDKLRDSGLIVKCIAPTWKEGHIQMIVGKIKVKKFYSRRLGIAAIAAKGASLKFLRKEMLKDYPEARILVNVTNNGRLVGIKFAANKRQVGYAMV